jgi:hypothetical protein
MRSLAMFAAAAVMVAFPAVASAASPCPPEVKGARALLTAKTATAAKATHPAKSQAAARERVQAPRGQDVQAPRGQDVQAPRGQDVQAPRGQDVQAPRGQDIQAPRGQDVQAPRTKDDPEPPTGPARRGQDIQAPRNVAKGRTNALANARRLVNEAEVACKDADAQRALANAHAALELLKYLP